MSRREEVEASIETILDSPHYDNYEDMWHAVLPFARTLADEVDARDAVIDKLLAMLEGEHPICIALHARACEIAGRKS